jgi:putative transposase
VTVVVADRRPLLGSLVHGAVILSKAGEVVHAALIDAPTHWSVVQLDEWVIMPDHLHAIFVLTGHLSSGLPQVIGGFKAAAARRVREMFPDLDGPLWQRSFHDRRLPTEQALAAARRYVRSNPSRP